MKKAMAAITVSLFLASMLSMAFVTPAKAQFLVDPYTVALWHFDEGSGQVAGDETGAYDGQLGSTTGVDSNDPTWTTDSKFGGYALSFDGADDYVEVGNIGVTGDWTVEFWAKLDTATPIIQYPIGTGPGELYGAGIFVAFAWEGDKWGVYDGASYILGSAVSADVWYHVAVTKSATTYTLYLNGNYENSGTLADTDITNLQIGRRIDAGGGVWYFNGIIDEVRISNIARPPLDVDPDTINLKSRGQWIAAYATVPGWHHLFSDDFERTDLGTDWTVVDGMWTIEDGKLSGYSDTGTGPHYGTAKLKIRTTESFNVPRIFAAEVTFLGWNPATSTEWQRVGMIIQKDPAFDTHASTPGKNDWALVIRGNNRLYLLNEYVIWGPYIGFTPVVGTTYRMKMAWDGSTIKGKAWAVGDPEPAWQLSVSWTNVVTDPSIGLYCSYAHAHFDNVIVTTYVSEIDLATVNLHIDIGTVPAEDDPKYSFVTDMWSYIEDVNGDGTLERIIKFSRYGTGSVSDYLQSYAGEQVTLTISGQYLDGTWFYLSYTVRVIKPGNK